MSRLVVLSALALWAGTTLLVADRGWFRRRPLAERLAPFGTGAAPRRPGAWSMATARDVLTPLASLVGDAAARLLGVADPLAARLERVHDPTDASAFRLRQLTLALAALAVTGVVVVAAAPPAAVAGLLVVSAPLAAFLWPEHRLGQRSERWQRRLAGELPVVAEQLGMLLAAGWSLGAALSRLAERGQGACAADLRRVVARLRHGVDEARALAEWSEVARVEAVERVVVLLARHREAPDLGRLVSEEARHLRRDNHRVLVARLERRAQQVWIPVTLAALVPGALLLAVPFADAMRFVAGG